MVLQAFDRLNANRGAYGFYEVHAEVDPRHGKDWLDKVVEPVVREHPSWAPRVVRGAWWRSLVDARFLSTVPALPALPALPHAT